MDRETKCPTCDAPDPSMHPSIPVYGKEEIYADSGGWCPDAFHSEKKSKTE